VAVELRQLRYFVTVAEELHFGRAAQRLHVVQPAVSQQVARLERELGLRLLDRSSRTVRLTEDGERMLAEARRVLAAADRTKAVAARLARRGQKVLRIGTSPGLAAALERAIDALSELTSGLRIELDGRPAHDQVDAVRRGELDIALVRSAPDLPGLRTLELWREPVDVALPAAHPVAARPAVRLDQLADLPLRLPSRDCDPLFHDLVLAACRRAGFQPRLGRPVSTVPNALVEIGTGTPAWTALYRSTHRDTGTTKTVVLPLDPPLEAPVSLVVSAVAEARCVAALHAAFLRSQQGAANRELTGVRCQQTLGVGA
jgi:DNA-binding transcriptional LysR family regulator